MGVDSKSYIEKVIDKEEDFDSEKWIEAFECITKNAKKVQKEVLEKILKKNGETEYLKKHGINNESNNNKNDEEIFKKCVPLVTYNDIQPCIERIANGDTSNILTTQHITSFILTSGTSEGKRKIIPFLQHKVDDTIISKLTSYAYRSREYPIDETKKALMFVYIWPAIKTKGGFNARYGSSIYYGAQKARLGYRVEHCSPVEVRCTPDIQQSDYCNLLCGLIYRGEVQFVSSLFAHSVVLGLELLQERWEEICRDIRSGVLSTRITDPSLRVSVSRLLKQDPELANTVYDICVRLSERSWNGLIPELFPNAKYVLSIMTGYSEKYVERLSVYAGKLPLIGEEYVCSEGRVGTNIDPNIPPKLTTYVVLPNVGYFEFLPTQVRKQQNSGDIVEMKPLGLTEVEIGQEYEVVITNFLGLYRYKLGDVVKVTGFYNSTPQLQFICRANVILSINEDKTSEKDLQMAVEEASKCLVDKVKIVDYTSYEDVTPRQEHYVIFWELHGDSSDSELQKCCNSLDRAIPDVAYHEARIDRHIGSLELRIVRRGTFKSILEHLASGEASSTTQFKMPKSLKRGDFLRIFDDNVVSSYFSTTYD